MDSIRGGPTIYRSDGDDFQSPIPPLSRLSRRMLSPGDWSSMKHDQGIGRGSYRSAPGMLYLV